MFHPEITMYGRTLHDQASANGSTHSRVLRTLLTQNLNVLMPTLHQTMLRALTEEMRDGAQLGQGL